MFLLVATRIGQLRIKSKCIRIRSAQFCFICFLFLRLIEIVIGVKMCGHLSVPHEWLFCFVSKFFPFIFSFVLLFCVLFHLQLFFSTKNKKKKTTKRSKSLIHQNRFYFSFFFNYLLVTQTQAEKIYNSFRRFRFENRLRFLLLLLFHFLSIFLLNVCFIRAGNVECISHVIDIQQHTFFFYIFSFQTFDE